MGVLLGHPASTEDASLALGVPEWQTTVDGRVLQLIDQRRDKRCLATARGPVTASRMWRSRARFTASAALCWSTDQECSSLLRIKAGLLLPVITSETAARRYPRGPARLELLNSRCR